MPGPTGTPPKGLVNGPLYGAAHYSTAYLNVPPNMHRLRNAIGLTVGIYVGRKMMDILAGETPSGKKVDRDDVMLALRPLHGLLAYNHFSDDPKDRWMKVFDMSVPAILGGIGAGLGSASFFEKSFLEPIDAKMTLQKKMTLQGKAGDFAREHFSLADAERRALHIQSNSSSMWSSLAAVFGSASGFGMLPSFLNYSSTLGTTFTIRAERAMVGPFKWMGRMFNSHSPFPFRPTKLVGQMVDYAAHNPSAHPQQLEAYAEGILKTWFRGIKPEQIKQFTSFIEEERATCIALCKTAEQAVSNHALKPEELKPIAEEALHKLGKNFSADKVNNIVATAIMERKSGRLPQDYTPEKIEARVANTLSRMLSETITKEKAGDKEVFKSGLESLLIKTGIDPREATVGDLGFVSSILHTLGDLTGMGTSKKMEDTRKLLHEAVEMRYPEIIDKFGAKPFVPKTPNYADSALKKTAATAFIGTGIGTVYAIGTSRDTSMADLETPQNGNGSSSNVHIPVMGNMLAGDDAAAASPDKSFAKRITPAEPKRKHVVHSKKPHGFINGQVLDTAEGITGMFNAGIGMHRVHCAMGLTVGSWLGDKVMEAMTGHTFAGKPVEQEKLWKPLQKIYNILPFNPHSDLPKDKWMQVLRWGMPAIIGTLAVVQGSKMFFEKRHEKLKRGQFLDEVEDKATMAQSEPWSYTSAISGLFGYPSGLPMLPLVNYSTNLGTRFSMGAGRKVALPIIGKYWSNNSTLFPYGPPGMLDLIIREAVNNKARDPELLETFTIGVLKPWFEHVTPQQVEAFVMKIHETRDRFFKDGGVPEDLKKQLEAELRAHFKGAGLEETLEEIGLDPLKATIANNGLSGAIANALGAKSAVHKIEQEYAKGYRERVSKRRHEQEQQDPNRSV